MPGALFDVFVVGAADPNPAAQAQLVRVLAGHLRLPVDAVARGVAEKRLKVGQNLDGPAAQALTAQLQQVGAVPVVRPAGAPTSSFRSATGMNHPSVTGLATGAAAHAPTVPAVATAPFPPAPAPAPATAFPQAPASPFPGAQPPGAPPRLATMRGTPIVSSAAGAAAAAARPGAADPFAPSPAPGALAAFGAGASGRDLFAAPTMAELQLSVRTPHPGARSPLAPAAPATAGPYRGPARGTGIELDRGPQTYEERVERATRSQKAVQGASATDVGVIEAATGGSDVTFESEAKMFSVRCPKHGLYYDRRKASGCRKCLEVGRQVATDIEKRETNFRLSAYREEPTRRALTGLGLALVLGFVPAAYAALDKGAHEVRALREEQQLLSMRAGSDDVLSKFDHLDLEVRRAHKRSMRNTALVWLLVSSGTFMAWYRVTG